jgi:multisubunit Na+/H+ antiporter MnhE subunit
VWWVLTAAVWLATVTSLTSAELAVAAACTLPCAVAARAARRANRGRWRFRIGWLRWIAIVMRDVPVQTVQAWAYALKALPAGRVRRRRGVISELALPPEPEPVAAARRAAAVLAFATTPGTVVLECDPHTGTVLLHRVRPRRGRLGPAVQR